MRAIAKTFGIFAGAAMLCCSLPLNTYAADEYDVSKGNFTYSPAPSAEPASETYFYSDGYFSAPSGKDNVHLRTMSMALALSTMEEGGSSYVTDLLDDIGFEDISVGDMNIKPTRNTIGTAIAHKKVNGRELVAVAVRGAKYDSEWAANLTAGTEGDIRGFDEAAEKVIERIKAYIDENELKDVSLWITGYSRGGTVADLAGVYINEHTAEFDTSADDVYIYTFEAPAASASDKIYDNIRETRNKNDIINYVYPESWGIHSNGKAEWIGSDKTLVSKTCEIGFQGVKVRDGETVAKDEFLRQFMDYLSGELTREKFSGDFDEAVSGLLELYFDKTPEERTALAEYFSGLKEQLSGENAAELKDNDAVVSFVGDDLLFGIVSHNSDQMYEKTVNDLKAVLTYLYYSEKAKGNVPISESDFNMIIDSLYPILRKLGPVIVKDMYYHEGMNTDDFLPADYNDPDYAPGYYEEEEEEAPEPVTEAEKGAADGKSAAWTGYSDGYSGNEKYAGYNDVPDDGEEHTEEYLEAYKQAYREEYEIQYEEGVRDCKSDYQKGMDNGDYCGERDAAQDIDAGNEYGTSYNDEPIVYEGDEPRSEEFVLGYKEAYKKAYDAKFRERPMYHVATFALNFNELWTEHQPQYNWELVKSLDSYYTEGLPEEHSDDPETVPAVLVGNKGAVIVPFGGSIGNVSAVRSHTSENTPVGTEGSGSAAGTAAADNSASPTSASDNNPTTGAAVTSVTALILAGVCIVSRKKR